MSGDKSSKTEKPTPKRLKKAREEGQIPKSQEILAWVSMLAAVFLVEITVKMAADKFTPLWAATADAIANPDEKVATTILGRWAADGLLVLAPLLVGCMLVGVVTNVAQVGFHPSSKLLKPKFDRVNPFKGVMRLFSTTTVWETVKAITKLSVLTLFTVRAVMGIVPLLIDGGRLSTLATVGIVADRGLAMVKNVSAAALVLAFLDYGYQRHKVRSQLKMSKQELKEESRESDGDPHQKGHIRSKQLSMSRNRMMAAVADASVIVVNPTHVSVALRYEANEGPPRVLAKGADVIAAKIREEAARHGIPIVEDVPLARTLFRACEVDDVIPMDLYDAVARVLAFIFALRRKGAPVDGIQHMGQSTLATVG